MPLSLFAYGFPLCHGNPNTGNSLHPILRCQRLERLNLTECLVQEAVRRARLQA